MSHEQVSQGGDSSRVAKIGNLYGKLENALNAAAGISIMVLMFFAVVQVVGRKVFNLPIFGYIDWVEQIMIVFAFVGIAYCQRSGGHVRMELVISHFRGRLLWFVEILGILVALFIVSALIPGSFEHFNRAIELGDSSINADLPIWPAKLIIPIAFVTLWLRLLLQLFGYLRLFIDPSLRPEAVPVIMRVEEEAAKEIQDAFGTDSGARR
jgi:TRAP-type C4-dicarboxylate transport system permease small subunit